MKFYGGGGGLNMKALILAIFLTTIFMLPVIASTGGGIIASWYGGGERLNEFTASGEVFNPQALTCASWDYHFGTRLKVTNVKNDKIVIVRVNDRGPNKRLGRAIDLTKRAFSKIADPKQGLILVKIERVN